MLYSDSHIWKQHVDLLYTRAIQGHLGANIQHNFFSQENPRTKTNKCGKSCAFNAGIDVDADVNADSAGRRMCSKRTRLTVVFHIFQNMFFLSRCVLAPQRFFLFLLFRFFNPVDSWERTRFPASFFHFSSTHCKHEKRQQTRIQ